MFDASCPRTRRISDNAEMQYYITKMRKVNTGVRFPDAMGISDGFHEDSSDREMFRK
jgi:hypothetical protein